MAFSDFPKYVKESEKTMKSYPTNALPGYLPGGSSGIFRGRSWQPPGALFFFAFSKSYPKAEVTYLTHKGFKNVSQINFLDFYWKIQIFMKQDEQFEFVFRF